MDVWPKVRERPSDSTFILESHACLSPPLDVHSFSQLALPCGAEYFSLAGLVFFLIPTSKKTGEGKEKEKRKSCEGKVVGGKPKVKEPVCHAK